MHVDDLARACLFLMRHYEGMESVNIGTGEERTIEELAALVKSIIYSRARLVFDGDKPDGTPRKRLDTGRLSALGWRHQIDLPEGIRSTYAWYRLRAQELNPDLSKNELCRKRGKARPARGIESSRAAAGGQAVAL
jgi:GDP-L-fucose synthase